MMQLHYLNEPEGELEPRPPDRNRKKAEEKDKGEIETGDEEPRSFASTGTVIDALKEAFKSDKELFLKLYGKTLSFLRYYFFTDMLNDLTAEDVVQESIKLIVTGRRKWYPDKTPNIINLLLMVIVSFIRNECKKKNLHLIGIDIYDKDGELTENKIDDLQRAYMREDINNLQFRDGLEDLITKLFKELENDINAYFVLEALLDLDHSTEIKPEVLVAKQLQLTEPDVINAIRRIRRRVLKLIIKK